MAAQQSNQLQSGQISQQDQEQSKEKSSSGAFDPNGSVRPTDNQTIPEIKAWLDAHKISYQSNASKSDLLALAK